MAQLENRFSWSKSRDEEFHECRRRYFYNRYLAWGGWEKNAPERTRLAYIYRNLKNRYAWKGESVHHAVEKVLKALRVGRRITCDEATHQMSESMRAGYRSSKARLYYQDPKNNLGLFEHEYEKTVTDETWKKVHDEAVGCLRNFYNSEFFRELESDDKKSWVLIEDLEEFLIEKATVYVKLDFARRHANHIEIYDWKTGKSDTEASVQIGAYALYAMDKWKESLSNIRAFLVNISTEFVAPTEQILNEGILEDAKKTIALSIAEMRSCLTDPLKNIPKPEEEFPYTENDRLCDYCAFKKICRRFTKA